MKKADITIGVAYICKISGRLVPVKITATSPHGGWVAANEATGREVRVRSAARLRRLAVDVPQRTARTDLGPVTPPTDLTTPRRAPSERGITLAYMRAWRQRHNDTGRDSSLEAFWLAHGLCPCCHGRGDVNSDQQETPRCARCGGTGLLRCPNCGTGPATRRLAAAGQPYCPACGSADIILRAGE